jgi:hypothetical protein
MNLGHLVKVINHQMRCVTSSWIGSALRFSDDWSRAIERNQSTDPKVTQSERGHGAHIISNSPSFLIKSFLSRVDGGNNSNPQNKLMSNGTNGSERGLSTSSTSTSPTTTSYIMRE